MRALSSVDFPALVYPTIDIWAMSDLLPRLALGLPVLHRLFQFAFELRVALEDAPSVGLELGLAGPAGQDAGALLGEAGAPATESGEVVAIHRQLHLEGADLGVGVLGEDVQDEALPVDHVAAEHLLEIALLSRCELVVEHDHVDVKSGCQVGDLLGLARPDIGGGVDPGASHQFLIHRLGSGGVGEEGELLEAALGVDGASFRAARRRPGRPAVWRLRDR